MKGFLKTKLPQVFGQKTELSPVEPPLLILCAKSQRVLKFGHKLKTSLNTISNRNFASGGFT